MKYVERLKVSVRASAARGVGVNATTNRVFVVNTGSGGSLSIINGVTHRVVDTIPLEYQPRQVGVDAGRNLIYVTNSNADFVWVIDGRTRSVITTIPVKEGPLGIAVNAASNRVYIANILHDSLSIIQGKQRDVSTVRVGHSPFRVAINEVTGLVYVGNVANCNVSVYAEDDLLSNGSFDRERDGRPVRWTPQNLGIDDKPVGGDFSQFPYDGKWAFQFVGQTGVDKRLTQTIAKAQPAGTRFEVEGFSKAEDASSAGRYEIEVTLTFTDNTEDVFRAQFPDGTHDWSRRAKALVAPKDVREASVRIIYADQTGKACFDAVRLEADAP